MAQVLDRVPVARINAEARQVRFLRVLLTVVTGLLFGVGWIFGTLWLAIAWSGTAVKVGWLESGRRGPG